MFPVVGFSLGPLMVCASVSIGLSSSIRTSAACL